MIAMGEIQDLINTLVQFRDERDWKQFHKPKDLAAALSIEAGELQELFLWKTEEEASEVNRDRVAEELADIFAYALLLVEHYEFDVKEIVLRKIAQNGEKYPVDKAKGRSTKYKHL
jgi:NTP pyrophosphatase (non-canonical NTP hydrolase)